MSQLIAHIARQHTVRFALAVGVLLGASSCRMLGRHRQDAVVGCDGMTASCSPSSPNDDNGTTMIRRHIRLVIDDSEGLSNETLEMLANALVDELTVTGQFAVDTVQLGRDPQSAYCPDEYAPSNTAWDISRPGEGADMIIRVRVVSLHPYRPLSLHLHTDVIALPDEVPLASFSRVWEGPASTVVPTTRRSRRLVRRLGRRGVDDRRLEGAALTALSPSHLLEHAASELAAQLAAHPSVFPSSVLPAWDVASGVTSQELTSPGVVSPVMREDEVNPLPPTESDWSVPARLRLRP